MIRDWYELPPEARIPLDRVADLGSLEEAALQAVDQPPYYVTSDEARAELRRREALDA